MGAVAARQQGTKAQFDVPTVPDWEFFRAAKAEFRGALESLISRGADDLDAIEFAELRRDIKLQSDDMCRWVDSVARERDRAHGNDVGYRGDIRLMTAFRDGMASGKIELDAHGSSNVFSFFYDETFVAWLFPQAVEYYVETGEIVELFREFSRHSYEDDMSYEESFAVDRAKLLRLYVFDLTSEQESRVRGEDHMMLPLEIRISFCGFHNDVLSDEERAQEKAFSREQPYTLDHTKPETLQGLERI